MHEVPLGVMASFIAAVVLQVAMVAMLPATKGYTLLLPTVACILLINAAIWLLARVVASGVQLSVLIPLSSVFIPLAVIAVGVSVYGEPAPALKIALLLAATGLIGWASSI